ncbi:amidohydrolase family protein [Caenimonas sedimenti]|uniref:Amidohydrolase family protein n=1 Tax=Caenimonas sedimenti TaxID=2596921 RepID=A0A562ZN26_9BURK|nr:amidohydrolase family protein [Caenimonas sedimenti]TWO69989.1 amidohydrolase family protein [Caenimonas sedimenti]
MLDLLISDATLPDGRRNMSVAVQAGKIVEITEGPIAGAQSAETVDAHGFLLTPHFVDPHFHMDATLSYGLPRVNESGTLLEGIALWGELKPLLKAEDMIARALAYCDWAVARGLLAIRSHVDTSDPSMLPVEAMLEVKKRVAGYIDLQLVAFPQDGVLRARGGVENLERALDLGVDVVGGIPHFERTMSEGAASVKLLCETAAGRGKLVDMHCDETDDPLSRHIETLAFETHRLGLQGRVNGSHCTSMHSMDNYYVTKLIPLIAESGVSVTANPLINITLQGRHDTYPKRRGMTRVPELLAGGVNVAFGHDCVMDPWYGMGSGDMLEVAHMGLHVAQMTSRNGIHACFDAVTVNAAKVMHLDGYGIGKGKDASFVLLQARDVVEAIRLRAHRLKVWRAGRLLAQAPELSSSLALAGRPSTVGFMREPVPPRA